MAGVGRSSVSFRLRASARGAVAAVVAVAAGVALAALAVVALIAAGCSAPTSPGDAPDAAAAVGRDVGADGRTRPAVAPARRIVSLAPSFTETVVALGAADALVGIGRFDPEVPGRPSLPRLGDATTVSLEALLALEPDLVLTNSTVLGEALRPVASRIRVVVNPADRLDDAIAMIAEIGRLAGRDTEAAALVAKIRGALDDARRRAQDRTARGVPTPKVLVVVQRRPLYAAGRSSFVAELVRAVGAANALDDVEQAWPCLSEEAAVARAPDVILDASEGDNATAAGRAALLEAWRRFPSVPAVRDGRVLVIREDAIFRAGPRIPEALARLEALIHPSDAAAGAGGGR